MNEPTVTLDVRDEIRRGNDPFLRIMNVDVELVWEPRWSPEMMTAAARAQVGMH